MAEAVGVIFSPGGRVHTFDPSGLELQWNERVICHTARGHEHGRVVKGNYTLDAAPPQPLKKVARRASEGDQETLRQNKQEARQAMLAFRRLLREEGIEAKPISAELVFDGSRVVLSYESAERQNLGRVQSALAKQLGRRVEVHPVGPREAARLCGDHGLCGTQHCCRRFPSHEKPITLRMAKDQDLPMSSGGRITGLCGRLRCCLAFEHPVYRSFRDRAPRVGRKVETPRGIGLVTGYAVLEDACTVEFDGADAGVAIPIDDCNEIR